MLRRAASYAGLIIGVLGVVFVARVLVREWAGVARALQGTEAWMLGPAFLVALASMTAIGIGWKLCIDILRGNPRLSPMMRSYFIGQLGKYVPGGIWPVIGRAEMARRTGLPGPIAYGSTLLSLGFTYLAAVLVVAMSFALGAGELEAIWLGVLGVVPLGIGALHPWSLSRIVALARIVTRRELEIPIPPWGRSVGLLLLHVPAWIGIGLATWLVAAMIEPGEADFTNVVFATSLAWFVGFVTVGVPGGIGVREAVFVGAATSLSSAGVAAAVAVVARVLFVLVDLSGAGGTAWLLRRGRGRASSTGSSRGFSER